MGSGLLPALNRGADRTAQWAAVALGFSIPISTALDNALLAIVLAGWLAGGAWREKWGAVRGNPFALAALILYGLLLAGTLYGARAPGDAVATLLKYKELLWIPVFAWVFREAALRKHALLALAASLALVLVMSYLLMTNLVPHAPFLNGDSGYPVVIKPRQTHGLLMAFGAFLFVHLALDTASRRMRMLWSALAVLAVANGTLVVQGGTGYLVLGILALYLGHAWKGWRGIAWAAGTAGALAAALMLVPGPFKERVLRVQSEVAQWRPGVPDIGSSAGTRIEFYRLSLEIVKDRPLLGHGTGSFTSAYAEKTKGQRALQTRNPHNEYLLWTVQFGIAGLAALLYLFWTHWRLAPRLATPLECRLARGLVLAIAVGCLLNSWLMDHTEGLLYTWLTGALMAGLNMAPRGDAHAGNPSAG